MPAETATEARIAGTAGTVTGAAATAGHGTCVGPVGRHLGTAGVHTHRAVMPLGADQPVHVASRRLADVRLHLTVWETSTTGAATARIEKHPRAGYCCAVARQKAEEEGRDVFK